MPEEIVLQLSHKDVYLGFFKELKQEVLALKRDVYKRQVYNFPSRNGGKTRFAIYEDV